MIVGCSSHFKSVKKNNVIQIHHKKYREPTVSSYLLKGVLHRSNQCVQVYAIIFYLCLLSSISIDYIKVGFDEHHLAYLLHV